MEKTRSKYLHLRAFDDDDPYDAMLPQFLETIKKFNSIINKYILLVVIKTMYEQRSNK